MFHSRRQAIGKTISEVAALSEKQSANVQSGVSVGLRHLPALDHAGSSLSALSPFCNDVTKRTITTVSAIATIRICFAAFTYFYGDFHPWGYLDDCRDEFATLAALTALRPGTKSGCASAPRPGSRRPCSSEVIHIATVATVATSRLSDSASSTAARAWRASPRTAEVVSIQGWICTNRQELSSHQFHGRAVQNRRNALQMKQVNLQVARTVLEFSAFTSL
ncbi:hypothetical protein CVS37_40815 [Burkholderia lata]|nr:hypothetical protein CVS37_40815 [Burkholderia lata]